MGTKVYQHILLTTNFSEPCKKIAKKTQAFAAACQATVYCAHIVDNLQSYSLGYMWDPRFNQHVEDETKNLLAQFSKPFGISAEHQWVKVGSFKEKIKELIQALNIDLIIAGHHSGFELSWLAHSHTTVVLNAAQCDVFVMQP